MNSHTSNKKTSAMSEHSIKGGHYLQKKRHKKIFYRIGMVFLLILIASFGLKFIKSKVMGTQENTSASVSEAHTDLTTIGSESSSQQSDNYQQAPQKSVHLSMELSDMLTVDADVTTPDVMAGGNDTVNDFTITPEIAQEVLFPHDRSTIKQTNVADQPGNILVNTEMGNQYHLYPGLFEFYGDGVADKDMLDEIALLLESWIKKHPGDTGEELSFMRAEDAVTYGEQILRKLGICYDPVPVNVIGLSHDAILQWQQACMQDPYYNEFGNRTTLSGLTDQSDSYYLSYTFRYKGLPVYGSENEPDIPLLEYNDNVPYKATATMLVTPQGVKYMGLREVYSMQAEGETNHLISSEEALDLLRKKFDEMIPNAKYCVSAAFLEYIPSRSGEHILLKPYWCFVMDIEYFDETTGKTEHLANVNAERFNAVTGKDLQYGG